MAYAGSWSRSCLRENVASRRAKFASTSLMKESSTLATIVIVDDQPELRKFLGALLTRREHRVLEASNGNDALALCLSAHPDLLITDLLMPDIDGYELVRRLRHEPGTAETRIIFFTGFFEADAAAALAERCGVPQVLQKPSTPDAILKAVDAALSAPPSEAIKPRVGFDREHARVLSDMLLRNADELTAVNSQLANSERQYREMFEGHPEPMWVLDAKSLAFLSVNDAAVHLYGYTREEFLAQSILDILPQEEIQASIARFQKTGIGPVSVAGVSRHLLKDGGLIEVEITNHKLQFGGRPAYSVLAHDVTERNRYERSLRESKEQLRLLAGRLQQVREDERALLARELHDDLGQSLTAIKMSLSWLSTHPAATPDAVSARIVSSMGLADRTINSVRRLASELRPGILDLGLRAAIEWQAEEFRYHADIRCELELPLGDIPLKPNQEVTLFRIFQETLTNVARHSGARLVTTRLTVGGGNVTLEVQDNGRGITPSEIAKRSSLGLLGMRERVQSLGGSLEILGCQATGTLVRVSVPVLHATGSAG
jgi:PAS domain S-box-containing protein